MSHRPPKTQEGLYKYTMQNTKKKDPPYRRKEKDDDERPRSMPKCYNRQNLRCTRCRQLFYEVALPEPENCPERDAEGERIDQMSEAYNRASAEIAADAGYVKGQISKRVLNSNHLKAVAKSKRSSGHPTQAESSRGGRRNSIDIAKKAQKERGLLTETCEHLDGSEKLPTVKLGVRHGFCKECHEKREEEKKKEKEDRKRKTGDGTSKAWGKQPVH